jgi:hypothetical protein
MDRQGCCWVSHHRCCNLVAGHRNGGLQGALLAGGGNGGHLCGDSPATSGGTVRVVGSTLSGP